MTFAGWLEIALFLAVLTALTPLVGGYMARVFTDEVGFLGFVERPVYRLLGRAARAGAGLEGLRALRAGLQRALLRAALPRPAHPERCTRSTRRISPRPPGTSRSTPPRRSCRTRTGSSTPARRRSRTSRRCSASRCRTSSPPRSGSRCWRPSSAGWPRARRASWATSTSTSRACCSTSCCRCRCSPACSSPPRGRSRASARLRTVHTAHRARADARAGARRLAGGDQAARDQRRRLLQRQLGDAVREPDVAHELRRDADDPRHPGRADRHLRPHGRQPPPGLGRVRGDDGPVRRRRRARLRRGDPPDARDARRRRLRPEHGGQGPALRHRVLLAVRRRHHGRLLRRGERARWSRSPASAAPSRRARS